LNPAYCGRFPVGNGQSPPGFGLRLRTLAADGAAVCGAAGFFAVVDLAAGFVAVVVFVAMIKLSFWQIGTSLVQTGCFRIVEGKSV
jgi:hypothetical protein